MAKIYKSTKDKYLKISSYLRSRARSSRKNNLITGTRYDKLMNKSLNKRQLEASIEAGSITNRDIQEMTRNLLKERRELRKPRVEAELRDTVSDLHKAGYTNIRMKNIVPFLDMMEDLKEAGISAQQGSSVIADNLDELFGRADIDIDDVKEAFNDWLENSAKVGEFEEYMPLPDSNSYDIEQ